MQGSQSIRAICVYNNGCTYIPEGLATCLILIPRGAPLIEAFLWAVFTSIPQPIFAPLAYISVSRFAALQPPEEGAAGKKMPWYGNSVQLYTAAIVTALLALQISSKK